MKTYFIENIRGLLLGEVIKKVAGTGATFEYKPDPFDEEIILTASLEFDEKDTIYKYGGGNVISVMQPGATTGTVNFSLSKHVGIEFYNKFMGFEATSKNEVAGLGNQRCVPPAWVQFIGDFASDVCSPSGRKDSVIINLSNVRFKMPKFEFEAKGEDTPENLLELEATFSMSRDPRMHGHGMFMRFEQFDNSKPGYNADIFEKSTTEFTYPAFIEATEKTPATSTTASITVTNPIQNVVKPDGSIDVSKTSVVYQDSTGTLTAVEATINEATNSAEVSLTSLVGGKNYLVFVNNGNSTTPIAGEYLLTIKTPTTRKK